MWFFETQKRAETKIWAHFETRSLTHLVSGVFLLVWKRFVDDVWSCSAVLVASLQADVGTGAARRSEASWSFVAVVHLPIG